MSRFAARTFAMETVFEYMMNPDSALSGEDFFTNAEGGDLDYAEMLIAGVKAHFEELKAKICEVTVGFAFSRIFKVDLAILLIAAYELLYRAELEAKFYESVPTKATVCNEAVNLAKRFSTGKSASFINAVLAKIDA